MSPKERVSEAFAATAHISVRTAHELRRWWRWMFAPLCDGWSGLSLNRFLAVLFGMAATHGRFAHEEKLTMIDVCFATLAGSLAFGKDVWVAYLQRKLKDEPDPH